MSEDTSTTTTSEPGSGDPGGSGTGEGADGGAGGTAAAEKFAAEREQLQREARERQSAQHKAEAEAARLKAELDKLKGASGDETPTPAAGLTAEQIQEQVRQAMRREEARTRELTAAVATAKEQYPNAEASVLDSSRYETAEEFLAAAQASHDRFTSHVDELAAKKEEELRARYAEKFGELPAPVETPADTPTGDPTVEQLSSMSVSQLEELEARTPGVIDRVLRSADQLNP